MSGDLQRLLTLHDIAARDGCGLLPELEALLRAETDAMLNGAIPLPVRTHSAGPAHQAVPASAHQLRKPSQ